jgi:hypothetical protein
MTMIQTINAVVTSVAIGTPVELNATPFLGGQRRNAILRLRNLPITSTVLLQGASRDPGTKAVPASGSAEWTTIVTLTSASAPVQEIILPEFIRWNTTVLDADGPNVVGDLEGVQ